MALVTLRVIDGADRGRVFAELPTPITIGREEGNTVQLNDERVSRFHVKIQEDHDKMVVTDLESTNGSKVNGEDIQIRIIRYGDVLHIGRSMLLFGNREQIAQRLAELRKRHGDSESVSEQIAKLDKLNGSPLDFELNWNSDPDQQATVHIMEPPVLPERLAPGQAAQLTELLEYFHLRIRDLVHSVQLRGNTDRVTLDLRQWQNLIDIESRLAEYLRAVAEPDNLR